MKIPKEQWEHCPNCNDCGVIGYEKPHHVIVTREMAMDAGDLSMEGCQWDWGSEYEYEPCEFCWTNPKSVYYQINKLWEKSE